MPKKRKYLKTQDLPKENPEFSGMLSHHFWSAEHFVFFEKYRESLNLEEAQKASGLSNAELKKLEEDPKMQEAMRIVKDEFLNALRLNPKTGASRFMQVFDKLEKGFDSGQEKVAAPLATMAVAFLKATGQLGSDEKKSSPKVSININLGEISTGSSTKEQPKNVNVKLINDSPYE